MADLNTGPVLSCVSTVNSKIGDLDVKDGQMIFIQDKNTIALDLGGKRRFYRQIEDIQTEEVRSSMLAPVNGQYYFVVSTETLWTYRDKWIQITTTPDEIKAYADELGKRATGGFEDDTVVITFGEQLFSTE